MGALAGLDRRRVGRGWAAGRVGYWPLNRRPESVVEARAATRSFLGASVSPGHEDAVLLVVTELVANAVQHGAAPIELRVAMSPDCIHIEVKDAGNRRPVIRAPTPLGQSGRGLVIVNGLGRWGYIPIAGSGKTVWCDVDVVPPQRDEPSL
jgi:hypothetical protein